MTEYDSKRDKFAYYKAGAYIIANLFFYCIGEQYFPVPLWEKYWSRLVFQVHTVGLARK